MTELFVGVAFSYGVLWFGSWQKNGKKVVACANFCILSLQNAWLWVKLQCWRKLLLICKNKDLGGKYCKQLKLMNSYKGLNFSFLKKRNGLMLENDSEIGKKYVIVRWSLNFTLKYFSILGVGFWSPYCVDSSTPLLIKFQSLTQINAFSICEKRKL